MASSANLQEATEQTSQRAAPSGSKRELWFLLAFLTVVYIAVLRIANRRFVWFDELLVFDMARSASLHQLWRWIVAFDSQPPAVYLLSRLSMRIFGPTPLGLRLPSMVEFYLGCVAILLYVRRWAGSSFAGLAVVLLWSGFDFFYATEARPYALMFMCFAWLLLSWDSAGQNGPRGVALLGVALSAAGLFCAHVLAPFAFMPFVVAEAVRFWRRRKVDYALWAALLLPMVVTLQYLPLVRQHASVISSPSDAPSFAKMYAFFLDTPRYVGPAAFLAVVVVLLFPAARTSERKRGFRPEDWAMLVSVALIPVFTNLLLMITNTQFYNRYCIVTDAMLCAGFAILLARRLNAAPVAGWAAIAAILIATYVSHRGSHLLARQAVSKSFAWSSYRPDLPLVDGDGLTFYEMNHHEGPQLLSRLYFLKNRQASLKYEQSNLFQDFEAPDDMKKAGFPLPAHVEAYSLFVRQHPQFLADGVADDWLLRLLHDQGATITLIGDGGGFNPYPRESNLYLVTMPGQ